MDKTESDAVKKSKKRKHSKHDESDKETVSPPEKTAKKKKSKKQNEQNNGIEQSFNESDKKIVSPPEKHTKKKKSKKRNELNDGIEQSYNADVTKEDLSTSPSAASSNDPLSTKNCDITKEQAKINEENKEKKREKMKAKKAAKRLQKEKSQKKAETTEGDQENDAETPAVQAPALEYLQKWKNDRKSWSFQKVRQVWLLQHMYEKKMVPTKYFTILLEYLEGMKGKAREVTISSAEKLIGQDDDDDGSNSDSESLPDETKQTTRKSPASLERARKVMQILT